jgi:phage terminase small subunit
MTDKKTNRRHEIFAREYVIDLNGTRAAIAAGYKKKGAMVRANELLGTAAVKALIAELTKAKCEKLDISADWVLGELRKLAGHTAMDLFNEDGSLKPMNAWSAESRAAIVGLDFDEIFSGAGEQRVHVGTTRKVKFADKLRALELLGKYLKLFVEKVEVDPSASFTEALARILERKQKQRKHG